MYASQCHGDVAYYAHVACDRHEFDTAGEAVASLHKSLLEQMCECVMLRLHVKSNYFSLLQHLSEVILPEVISELFRRLIAAHEYFPTRSTST